MVREVMYKTSYLILPFWLFWGYFKKDISPLNHICSIYGIGVLWITLIYAMFFTQNVKPVIHFTQYFAIIFISVRLYVYFLINMKNKTTTLVYKFSQNENQQIIMYLNVYYIILYFSLFVSSLFISHPICTWMFRLILLFFICNDILYSTTLNNNETKFADLLIILFVVIFLFYEKPRWFLWLLMLVMTVIATYVIYNKLFDSTYLNMILSASKIGVVICLITALLSSTNVVYKILDLNISEHLNPSVIIRQIRKSDLKKLLL